MSALLQLENVRVRLGAVLALNGVSLTVRGGEIIALLGPNGAGKTTLLRAGLGLAPLQAGRALLGGTETRALSARQRALRAAYLPQGAEAVWPVRVERLVALGRFAHGAAPERLGQADGAAVERALTACGLLALRGRRMDQLSGGEKARAHLARALAQEAPLLVLDEPSAGLDPAQALGVAAICRAHAENGGGVLLSTHDIALAAGLAHRAALLRDGEIIAEGAPEAALSEAALRQAYGRAGKLARVGAGWAVVFE